MWILTCECWHVESSLTCECWQLVVHSCVVDVWLLAAACWQEGVGIAAIDMGKKFLTINSVCRSKTDFIGKNSCFSNNCKLLLLYKFARKTKTNSFQLLKRDLKYKWWLYHPVAAGLSIIFPWQQFPHVSLTQYGWDNCDSFSLDPCLRPNLFYAWCVILLYLNIYFISSNKVFENIHA